MPQFLRKIRRGRWAHTFEGIPENDIPAESFKDLKTEGNCFSVWVLDEEKASSLERIVAVLAAMCDKLANFDYAILSQEIIADVNIELQQTPGDSPDDELNHDFHLDLIQLTGRKLLRLAENIYFNEKVNRIPHKEVAQHVYNAVDQGQINKDEIKFYDEVIKIVK